LFKRLKQAITIIYQVATSNSLLENWGKKLPDDSICSS